MGKMKVFFIFSTIPKESGFKRDYRWTVKRTGLEENHAGQGGTFITIKNHDQTCCNRAIDTTPAKVDGHPMYIQSEMVI